MLNFPAETFWLIVPWPFIWITLGIVMYFVHRRGDKKEDEFYSNSNEKGMR